MVAEPEKACPAKATSMLLYQASSDSRDRNLFLIPDGFSSGAVFSALAPLLSHARHVSVYTLNSPFLKIKPDSDRVLSIEELAGLYVAEIRHRQPEGPYMVGVERMFLIDTACPTFACSMPDVLVGFLDSINRFGVISENDNQENKRSSPIASDRFTLSRQQLSMYQVSKLPGRNMPQVVLFSAREGADKQDEVARPEVQPAEQQLVDWFLNDRAGGELFEWDKILENVGVVPADGNHFSMMLPPTINGWGCELARLLDA
ncbi:Alpha/Beta hydrolase protein [Aspergillus pseudocaelatus]|uniref:Alpha/Beta hydrolase protein n=1 Tax=Aspergillus pseudocaelatus TaxID=1825620 RepID=A0ABQ6W7L0_9EURO|nr:Alpha/Beta hydrolase protein [Aspergillus pseudocaelatus]